MNFLLLACLNLTIPAEVYVSIDMEVRAEQALAADLQRRSNIRLYGDDGPQPSSIQRRGAGWSVSGGGASGTSGRILNSFNLPEHK